jgi:hypothetical protein
MNPAPPILNRLGENHIEALSNEPDILSWAVITVDVGPSNYLNRHKFGIKIVMADFTF